MSSELPDFTIRLLRPDQDAELVHSWVTQDRARFWGMQQATQEEVRQTYRYVESLPSHDAYLVLHHGRPVALFQAYAVGDDPLAQHYDAQDGDLGLHLLMAPMSGPPQPGFTAVVFASILGVVGANPDCRRLVAEPDADNTAAIARLVRLGFTLGPLVQLPHKRARLTFRTLDSTPLRGTDGSAFGG